MNILDDLDGIVAKMRAHGIASTDWREDGCRLQLHLSDGPPPQFNAQSIVSANRTGTQIVTSPEMGVFRTKDTALLQTVAAGDVIGYVDLGALRVAIVAPVGGVIDAFCVRDGSVIGYGDSVAEITLSS